MTDPTALAPYPYRFESYIEPARARPAFWRLLLGSNLTVAALFAVAAGVGFLLLETWGEQVDWLAPEVLERQEAAIILICLLGALGLIWLVLPPVTLLLHKRGLRSLIGRRGGGAVRWLWGGFTAIAVIAIATVVSLLLGATASVTWQGAFDGWLLLACVAVLVVVFQAGAEELFFRGYLVQQSAARFRSPLVWGLIPALLFGLMHYNPDAPEVFRYGFVLLTTLFGLLMTYTVYRTGSLHFAMGLHIVNNWLAFLTIAPEGEIELSSLALWIAPVPTALELLVYAVVNILVVVAVIEGLVMRRERFV